MANKECTKCIHHPVCKTAESCDGYVSGCKHFVVISNLETTTREKLIELLNRWPCFGTAEEHADYLIANGVTVQEWISVKDRLPEDSVEVNLHTRSGVVGTGFYDKYTKSWVQWYSGGAICVDVTHWMPLPQPPKGE